MERYESCLPSFPNPVDFPVRTVVHLARPGIAAAFAGEAVI